jgi:hypothetical protein
LAVAAMAVSCKKKSDLESSLGSEGAKLLEEKQLPVADAGKELNLAFVFDPKNPVRYRMAIAGDIEVAAAQMGRQNIKMDMQITFEQKAPKVEDPVFVDISFLKQRIKMDMKVMGKDIKVDINGHEVVASADGSEIVNTQEGVGQDTAKEFLKDLDFEGNTISVKTDRRGRALEWKGEPKLIELFSDNGGGEGFFPLTLPAEKVAMGKPWWSEFVLEKLQNIKLRGGAIKGMVRFVALGEETVAGKKLVKIQMDAPMVIEDRKAKVFVENLGQDVDAKFEHLKRNASGVIYFDSQQGVMYSADLKVSLDGRMSIEAMGQEVDMNIKADMTIKFAQVAGI